MRRFVLAALALTVFAACQPATTELTEEQKAEIATEVDSVMDVWWTVWSTDIDFDRALSFTADDPNMVWINDASPFYGRSGIDENLRPLVESMQRQEVTPIDSRTIVLSAELAYTVRINSLVHVDTAGNSQPEIRWGETILWIKRNGEWKVLGGHGSSPADAI